MPRVHYVVKAQKDNPAVKKGEPYYWWKFRHGGKQYSKHRPKASQLTQSSFLSNLYALQEDIEESWFKEFDDIESERDDLISRLEELRDECQESLDNMPENLAENSSSGQLLQERIDELETAVDNISGVDIPEEPDWPEEFDDWEGLDPSDQQERKNEWKAERCEEVKDEILNSYWPQL